MRETAALVPSEALSHSPGVLGLIVGLAALTLSRARPASTPPSGAR